MAVGKVISHVMMGADASIPPLWMVAATPAGRPRGCLNSSLR